MLKASNITISYAELLFKNVTFSLGNKEKIGLVGLNGCGKSTLLRIINGDEQPDRGNIEAVGEKIGYLPQEF